MHQGETRMECLVFGCQCSLLNTILASIVILDCVDQVIGCDDEFGYEFIKAPNLSPTS